MQSLDNESYDLFFKHFYKRLWVYIATISRSDTGEIEEILQITFEKVIKNVSEYEDEGEFWAWLCTIAKNSFIDRTRQKTRSIGALGVIYDYFSFKKLDEVEIDPIDILTLRQAISELDSDEISLIEKRYFYGYSNSNIADHLGLSLKSIESKLARTRKKLKHKLIEREGDD